MSRDVAITTGFHWGFSRGKLTTGVLLTAVDHWLRLLEEGVDICAVIFDYQKAFDIVVNRNLLQKLEVNTYSDG